MISGGGVYPEKDDTLHPLVHIYEERIGSMIGKISKYIVERNYSETMKANNGDLDLESALEMSKGILDEVSILVGPSKMGILTEDLEELTKKYFKEGQRDE